MTLLAVLLLACASAPSSAPAPAPPVASAPAPARAKAPPAAPAAPPAASAAAGSPERALQDYYAALEAHDYRTAWRMWEDDGAASGKTLREFTAGFADTAHTRVVVGTPGKIEGASGSSYVTVPVDVYATLKAGTEQHFAGTYDLRRINAAGGAPGTWHLHAASLRAAP